MLAMTSTSGDDDEDGDDGDADDDEGDADDGDDVFSRWLGLRAP